MTEQQIREVAWGYRSLPQDERPAFVRALLMGKDPRRQRLAERLETALDAVRNLDERLERMTTAQQREFLTMAGGANVKQAALRIGVSERTSRKHLEDVLWKVRDDPMLLLLGY